MSNTIDSFVSEVKPEVSRLPLEIIDVTISKFNNTEVYSIFSQMLNIKIYQSLFAPTMSAVMTLYDPVSLHVNLPLLGEETVKIYYIPTRENPYDPKFLDTETAASASNTKIIEFRISEITHIEPDNISRSSTYSLSLVSPVIFYNSKYRVQKAYKDTYDNAIQDILTTYLQVPTNNINKANFEKPKGIIPFIVPNLKPIEAIHWMMTRAVPADLNHKLYIFYENFYGFHFKTIQNIIENRKNTAFKVIYLSDNVEVLKKYHPDIPDIDQRVVEQMVFNKLFSNMKNIQNGLYENEYFNVDVFNKAFSSVQKTLDENFYNTKTIDKNGFNTPEFIANSQSVSRTFEAKTRVCYRINQFGGDDPSNKNYFDEKFGETIMSQFSMGQISISISLPGNSLLQVGNMIEFYIPTLHGYTQVDLDYYISGYYVITNICHDISINGIYTTRLDLNRDSFVNKVKAVANYA